MKARISMDEIVDLVLASLAAKGIRVDPDSAVYVVAADGFEGLEFDEPKPRPAAKPRRNRTRRPARGETQ